MSTYPLVHGRRFELPAVGPVLAAMCTVKLRDGAQRTLDDWWRIMFTTGPQPRVGPTGVAWRVGDIAGTTPWDHATPQLALAALVERKLLPAHWLDAARAPAWWCDECYGVGSLPVATSVGTRASLCVACGGDGHTAEPPSHRALASVAALGAIDLSLADIISAGDPARRVVWRVAEAVLDLMGRPARVPHLTLPSFHPGPHGALLVTEGVLDQPDWGPPYFHPLPDPAGRVGRLVLGVVPVGRSQE